MGAEVHEVHLNRFYSPMNVELPSMDPMAGGGVGSLRSMAILTYLGVSREVAESCFGQGLLTVSLLGLSK